jgi:hypothetical protein
MEVSSLRGMVGLAGGKVGCGKSGPPKARELEMNSA